jgi:hypothetical protein
LVLAALFLVYTRARAECEDVLSQTEGVTSGSSDADALRAACKGQAIKCTPRCSANDTRYTVFASFTGGFGCPGKRERILSLFPCGDAPGIHGVAGIVVLLQATQHGWRAVSRHSGTVLSPPDDCNVERFGLRDVVVCRLGWGPYQGVIGTSLCVTSIRRGKLTVDCPVRVSSDDEVPPTTVRVLPGRPEPGKAVISVEVRERRLLIEVDENGVRPSAQSIADLTQHPIPGVELQER